jgi:hypothetical protein
MGVSENVQKSISTPHKINKFVVFIMFSVNTHSFFFLSRLNIFLFSIKLQAFTFNLSKKLFTFNIYLYFIGDYFED